MQCPECKCLNGNGGEVRPLRCADLGLPKSFIARLPAVIAMAAAANTPLLLLTSSQVESSSRRHRYLGILRVSGSPGNRRQIQGRAFFASTKKTLIKAGSSTLTLRGLVAT